MRHGFELQGHRGARGLFAENTLEGFVATMALGVSSLELDVGVTQDGVMVVHHDFALNPDIARGPDGRFLAESGAALPLICQLRHADLTQYDVGRIRPTSTTAASHPGQCGADGVRIPALADLLDAISGTGMTLDVELKTDPARPGHSVAPEDMARQLLDVARSAVAEQRLVVRSFDWRGLLWLQEQAPQVPLVWLSQGIADPAGMIVASDGRGTWAPDWNHLSEAGVATVHAAGLRVIPWTVNRADVMRRLIAWGVDGICTDRPDIARAVMAQCGLALPQSC